jgi:hypothetical protein
MPAPPRPLYGGRHRAIPDRNCVAAIVYMARTSTPWRLLPARELGCGSPATCWCRLTEWSKRRSVRPAPPGGVGPAGRAGPAGLVAGQCGHHERAGQAWGDQVGANPVDRGKPGSKLHLVCDGGGLPLTAAVTAANASDTPCSRRSWTMCHRSARRRGGGAPGQERSTRTRATTVPPTGPGCAGVGSGRGSPGVGWGPRRGWAGSGGRSSGRLRAGGLR